MKIFVAGIISCLLITASVLGALALWGAFNPEPAEAYGATGVGAKYWYFAEGYTGPGFEEWLLLYNPPADVGGSGYGADVFVKFYGPGGHIGDYIASSIGPGERRSVNVNQVLVDWFGYSGDVSIVCENTSFPFIAERALYFEYKGQWTGGSQVLGYNEGPNE